MAMICPLVSARIEFHVTVIQMEAESSVI